MEDHTKHYLISGRVQGVGFRMFVYRVATELSLSGWVRNLADGRVEALVTGFDPAINKFEERLRAGPPRARVERVTASARKLLKQGAGFVVKEDGDHPCADE